MIIKCLLNDYNKSYGYSNPYTILFTLEFLILKHKLYPGILYFLQNPETSSIPILYTIKESRPCFEKHTYLPLYLKQNLKSFPKLIEIQFQKICNQCDISYYP